jgi:hypothetical protein
MGLKEDHSEAVVVELLEQMMEVVEEALKVIDVPGRSGQPARQLMGVLMEEEVVEVLI